MPPPMKLSPPELAAKLLAEGPAKQEPSNRRIRGLLGGQWIFDTLKAQYVWEHPYYPTFYVPIDAIRNGSAEIAKKEEDEKGFWLGTLHSGDKSVAVTGFDKGPLEGLIKLDPSDIEWFAEDEKMLGPHPKDPYKRIECLPSSREIRIEVDGTVVAQSSSNVFLYETLLRTRYYLPPTAITDWSMLTPSDTTTFCPYKSNANYYHLTVGEKEIKDAIWYYTYPTQESAAIQGRLCFYNEKVDVFVDGEKEK